LEADILGVVQSLQAGTVQYLTDRGKTIGVILPLGVCAAETAFGVGVGRMGHADKLQAVRAGPELSAAAVASGLAS
jgi:antitoxin (DNA-binding transcriptional repressor) of toxin-antitoxin stability system